MMVLYVVSLEIINGVYSDKKNSYFLQLYPHYSYIVSGYCLVVITHFEQDGARTCIVS